jgi:4'-phosphopantetheinyl transferase
MTTDGSPDNDGLLPVFVALRIDWQRLLQLDLDALCMGLPMERSMRIARLHRVEDRFRGVLAGKLAQAMFVHAFPGQALPDIAINALGRPFFEIDTRFDFNLSHSGDWVVGLADCLPVGVDVEQIDPLRPLLNDVLAPGERTALAALPASERGRQFTTLWTLKEARAKSLGQGLRLDFRQLAFDLTQDGSAVQRHTGGALLAAGYLRRRL